MTTIGLLAVQPDNQTAILYPQNGAILHNLTLLDGVTLQSQSNAGCLTWSTGAPNVSLRNGGGFVLDSTALAPMFANTTGSGPLIFMQEGCIIQSNHATLDTFTSDGSSDFVVYVGPRCSIGTKAFGCVSGGSITVIVYSSSASITAQPDCFTGTFNIEYITTLQGNAVEAGILTSVDDGYVLTWKNSDNQWEPLPINSGAVTLAGDVKGPANANTAVSFTGTTGVFAGANSTVLALKDASGHTASAGVIRLPNNTAINQRNAANSADYNLATINGSNVVTFGDTTNAAAVNLVGGISVVVDGRAGGASGVTTLLAGSHGGEVQVSDTNIDLHISGNSPTFGSINFVNAGVTIANFNNYGTAWGQSTITAATGTTTLTATNLITPLLVFTGTVGATDNMLIDFGGSVGDKVLDFSGMTLTAGGIVRLKNGTTTTAVQTLLATPKTRLSVTFNSANSVSVG
jgi:hypothetical protein